MMENKATEYPKTASVIALTGSILIVLCGTLLTWVSAVILPNLNFASFPNVHTPPGLTTNAIPAIASSVLGGIGAFGLVSGAVVLACAVLLIAVPNQRTVWGVLILVFSALSLLGFGGFLVGAVLGIVGGFLALRWKPSTA